MEKLLKFLKDEEGIVAIEYGLIAAGIAIAIAGTVLLIGTELKTVFNDILKALKGESPTPPPQ